MLNPDPPQLKCTSRFTTHFLGQIVKFRLDLDGVSVRVFFFLKSFDKLPELVYKNLPASVHALS